jgi:hypothetical protein
MYIYIYSERGIKLNKNILNKNDLSGNTICDQKTTNGNFYNNISNRKDSDVCSSAINNTKGAV